MTDMDGIILLAGSAARLNMGKNKVYLPLNDKLVFVYALEKMLDYLDRIILVIKENELDYIMPYLSNRIFYTIGGATRQESVYNGVKLTKSKTVLIHDGARPFISNQMLDACLKIKTLGLTVVRAKDSIYYDGIPLKRENVLLAQTPQVVDKELYLEAYLKAREENQIFTDDVSLVLNYNPNLKIEYIEGSYENIKITSEIDYVIAKELVKNV